MKKGKQVREFLKRYYKESRKEDGISYGRKKNELIQTLHGQTKLTEGSRDKELIESTVKNLKDLTKQGRFRKDFPSFAKFYEYVTDAKNDITMEDLKNS